LPEDYIRASTSNEVTALLRRHGEKARVIGGGTMLYEFESRGLLSGVTTLIDISKLGLDYVKEDSSGLRIGASTTFTDALRSRQINSRPAFGALADALSAIRPVQVRNMATVGGAICSGLPVLDLPPASVAVRAKIALAGSRGRRTLDVEDFFLGFLETALKRGEFLMEVRVPRPPAHTGSAFQKLETNSVDWAVLSVATSVTLKNDKVSNARIVFGGGVVGAVPMRATEAEEAMVEAAATEDVIGRAAEEASRSTEFADDERASADYRRQVARVLVRESLANSVERARRDKG